MIHHTLYHNTGANNYNTYTALTLRVANKNPLHDNTFNLYTLNNNCHLNSYLNYMALLNNVPKCLSARMT